MGLNVYYEHTTTGSCIDADSPSELWRILDGVAMGEKVITEERCPQLRGAAIGAGGEMGETLANLACIIEAKGPIRIWRE